MNRVDSMLRDEPCVAIPSLAKLQHELPFALPTHVLHLVDTATTPMPGSYYVDPANELSPPPTLLHAWFSMFVVSPRKILSTLVLWHVRWLAMRVPKPLLLCPDRF